MTRSISYILLISVIFLLGISCSDFGEGGRETKPPASQDQRLLAKKELMSVTTYNITVNTDAKVLKNFRTAVQKLLKKGDPVIDTCSGQGTMTIYTDFSQKMDGTLSCFGIKFNLADTLAAPEVERVRENMNKYAYYGLILREANPPMIDGKIPEGSSYFYPPRPLMINPLTDPSKIPTPIVENASIIIAPSSGEQIKSRGTFTLEIIDPKAPIPSDVDGSYIKRDLVHIDVRSTGFQDIPNKAQYLLFPSRQMFISLNPVIIAKMIITAPMADILNSNDSKVSGSFLKSFIENLTITFSMKQHEIK